MLTIFRGEHYNWNRPGGMFCALRFSKGTDFSVKILAISGGKKDGNNDAMAREALIGAKEQGAEIEFIRLHDLNLKPCKGCSACIKGMMKGGTGDCPIKDDMKWLDEKIFSADGVLFAMPVFEKGAPGIMQLVMDRLFGPAHDPGPCTIAVKIAEKTGGPGPDKRKLQPKVVSFISMGGSDWMTRVAADMSLAAMTRNWKIVENVVFSWSKSIVVNDEAVARCNNIGANLTKAAELGPEKAKYIGDPGICPECGSRNFYIKDDPKETTCVVCGLAGELRLKDGKMAFDIPEDRFAHSHFRMSGKLEHMGDISRAEAEFDSEKCPEHKARTDKYKGFIQSTLP